MPKKNIHQRENLTDDQRVEIDGNRDKRNMEMQSSHYFAGENPVDPYDFRSAKFKEVPMPQKRGVLKNQYKRNIDKNDLHWRNVQLLSTETIGARDHQEAIPKLSHISVCA